MIRSNSFFQAGNSVRDDIVSSLIGIISTTPDLHGYTAYQLYKIIRNDITQQPLVQVASWTLGNSTSKKYFFVIMFIITGEFGDLFINGQYQKPDDGENIQVNTVIEMFINIVNLFLSD